ncbi:potassium two pore domain channel subfamily K member 1 [Phyllostomus discolor]|uniref:Potassium two pore domain channel subfamily K member 1 n=1 Tax=Phyllostomus discolor TaxID=89673 RepID=A0A833Y7X5_9CHIR|nr:potassium two pore domain channel subfamily K member 1 [Phyllostomus discolor]
MAASQSRELPVGKWLIRRLEGGGRGPGVWEVEFALDSVRRQEPREVPEPALWQADWPRRGKHGSEAAAVLEGYGHTVPLSDGGKAFCIIYSVIGIPFTLLFLTAVVQRITVHVTRRPVLYFHVRWGFSKQAVAIVHAVLLGLVTVSCFFFIPAAVFSVLEDDWNFLESFYFCFISLSTIGLGDYVPGEGYNQKFRELYKIGITCYLLLGLIAMLVVLETFCELHELKKFRKMFYVKKDKDEDQAHIMEHDQLSFSSIADQAAGLKEDQKQDEPFVTPPSPVHADGPTNH